MTHALLDPLLHGTPVAQRRAIAKAITLLESTRADHLAQADEMLTALLPLAFTYTAECACPATLLALLPVTAQRSMMTCAMPSLIT